MVLVDICWCCVSTGQYWLVLDGTGSVEGGTGWYLAVLGHYKVVLVATLRYWVSIGCCVSTGRYWLVLDDTGSVEGGSGRYLVVLGQQKAVLVGT